MFDFSKERTLVSCIPKKNKNEFMISLMHHDEIDDMTGNLQKPVFITA